MWKEKAEARSVGGEAVGGREDKEGTAGEGAGDDQPNC